MELVGCKMSSIKLLKLNWTPESIPTAWVLISVSEKEKKTENGQIVAVKDLNSSKNILYTFY